MMQSKRASANEAPVGVAVLTFRGCESLFEIQLGRAVGSPRGRWLLRGCHGSQGLAGSGFGVLSFGPPVGAQRAGRRVLLGMRAWHGSVGGQVVIPRGHWAGGRACVRPWVPAVIIPRGNLSISKPGAPGPAGSSRAMLGAIVVALISSSVGAAVVLARAWCLCKGGSRGERECRRWGRCRGGTRGRWR